MSLFKNVGSVEIYFEIAGRGYTVPPGKVISLGDEFDYVPESRGLPLEMVDECAPGDKVPSVSLAEVKLASAVEDDLPGGDADTIMKVRNAAARSKRK